MSSKPTFVEGFQANDAFDMQWTSETAEQVASAQLNTSPFLNFENKVSLRVSLTATVIAEPISYRSPASYPF